MPTFQFCLRPPVVCDTQTRVSNGWMVGTPRAQAELARISLEFGNVE